MRPIDWQSLWSPEVHPVEVVLRATLIYLFAQVVMRLIGRKELGRYSNFDVVLLFLVSVAVRKSLVKDDESLTTAFLALATLGAWDRFFSWLSSRSRKAARVLEGTPVELVRDGRLLEDNMRRSLISKEELLSRLRANGTESLRRVRAAYMEPDGKVTFLMKKDEGEGAGLQ
jgi:uncharacterized membrane protein YcaP (DUF421 family)